MEYNNFSLIHEFKTRQYIITNTDLDGILCAAILCKTFPNLHIGEFTNSHDKIWVHPHVNKDNSIYLDLYLTNPDILCIDNHIVGFTDKAQYSPLKINPNIIRRRSLTTYKIKYPFSTFMFILRILETKGYFVDIDIDKIVGKTKDGSEIYLWELLLRADDTLSNSFYYYKNANEWWVWMLKYSHSNSLLYKLHEKIVSIVKTGENAKQIKDKVQCFLKEKFNIFNDGFKYINNPFYKDFVEFVSSSLDNTIFYNFNVKTIDLLPKREEITNNSTFEDFKDYNIKTLAFVKNNLISFSYV